MEPFNDLHLGIANAWIFMLWQIILPFLVSFLLKGTDVYKRLNTNPPMKHEKLLNVTSMVIWFLGFLYSIFLPLKFEILIFYVGFFIFVLSLVLSLSAIFTLKHAQPGKHFKTGPYRFSQHPFYVAILLTYLSVTMMSLSVIFLFFTILYTWHLVLFASAEEADCLKIYGKEYQAYMEKTPRWLGLPRSKGQ
jgi:protein-S-isoprenylcysteine O-methyltransferase Ste14